MVVVAYMQKAGDCCDISPQIFFGFSAKGAHPCTSSSGQGGGKRVLEDFFFKNPTTQLRVVWGLTEKKCEQTPKFACFSV